MPKIISRVKERIYSIGKDINKSRKEAGIGVHSGGRIGSKSLGLDFGKSANTFLPFRSKLQSYKRLNKEKVKNKEKFIEKRIEYIKGGKKIMETYRRENKPIAIKKSTPKKIPINPYYAPPNLNIQDLKKRISRRKSFWL